MNAVYRPGAPQSCAQCEKAMSRTKNPDGCYYRDFFKMDTGCPFEILRENPEVEKVYAFVQKSMDSWDTTDDSDPKRKVKTKHYGMSIEKFNFATKVHNVREEDMLEAVSWATLGAKAADEAKDLARKSSRGDRFK